MNEYPIPPDKETLLVEYQSAQESAEHHDNLVWTVTSIIWSGSLILFGFVLGSLGNLHLRIILTLLSILGIALTVAVWGFVGQLNAVKKQKYNRCKEIESILDMHHHRSVRYLVGFQQKVYASITIYFIVVWLCVLYTVWIR